MGYADSMGVKMTEAEAQEAVDTFRRMYPEVVAFWAWCKEAVFHTTMTGGEFTGAHGLKTFAKGEFLMMRLPSGRCISYHKPKIQPVKAPWGDMIDSFTFMGKDRLTLQWQRISAHPGFITENIIQGLSRDILGVWMSRAHKADFNLVLHVHDELAALEKANRLEELNALIREPIKWAPGLLLDADGYVAKRYRKD
jgi:DNA polymerase